MVRPNTQYILYFTSVTEQLSSEVDCYREKPSVSLVDYRSLGAAYDWVACNRIQAASLMYPHCKFAVLQHVKANEELKQSEILPILVIMRWRMSLYSYQQHEVFPVRYLVTPSFLSMH